MRRTIQTAVSVGLVALASSTGMALARPPETKEPLTPQSVRTKVLALKKEDVAWRKIEWKTCLLEGIQESRKQKKPILLWVFIDRPIDDERC